MKKQSILAMAMVLGLAGSTSFPTQAASECGLNGKLQSGNCVVVKTQVKNLPKIKSTLEELCERLQNGNMADCPIITLPDCNQPDNGGQPNVPDVDVPENQPETNVPEQGDLDENETDTGMPGENDNQPDINIPSVPDYNPEWDMPETGSDLPEADNEMLSYAKQVVKLVNEERAKAGLHALVLDTEVASAALIRAKEIETSFSHTRPDGRGFSSVLTDNGIRFTGAGENIAWGQTSPEEVMEAWMNSEGHRANILNAKFTKIGVGHYQNASGKNYWAQLFTY